MTVFAETKRIANALVNQVSQIGMSKKEAKEKNLNVVRSLGTQRNYVDHVAAFLDHLQSLRQSVDGLFSSEQMQDYLYDLADQPRPQKYINTARQALQITFQLKLDHVESEVSTILTCRAYSEVDVSKVVSAQNSRNALSTRLCYSANLRAHELLTIRRADEIDRSAHRDWRPDLFVHLEDFTIYTVTGKGGLTRYVPIPKNDAIELEKYRVPDNFEIIRRDRKIDHSIKYTIPGGQSFSQSFSKTSKEVLGFSHGAHGLRHSYAQKRLAELRAHGMDIENAMEILSQELGHFRPDIVLDYLR